MKQMNYLRIVFDKKEKKKKTDETSIVEVKYLDSVKFYTMEIFQILLINNNDR